MERTSWWTRSSSISPPGTCSRSSSTLINRLQRGKKEGHQNKGQAVWINHSTSWTYTFRREVVNSWCNSSCFWPLTWTIPIPTPQMRQHLFSCIQNQAIAMKKYRRAPRLLVSTDTYPVYCICILPNTRDVYSQAKTGWNVVCSTCKEWYHYDTCIKLSSCMLLLLANQLPGTALPIDYNNSIYGACL